ncbi:hypothetical protein [Aurantiacibacter rhizosphaerae]|uniref:hypothetical protein n=1 Tax=Aurantiacibacter rhizosphaerae TaxID=2691582 RepID=UPI0019217B8B|nr:hypothetical protein [Aurantiacibacter rhizosphaerae]
MIVHTTPDTTNLVTLRPLNAPPSTGPVPLLTPPKQAAFCKALADHGNVRLACRAVQVSPQTAYRARRASPAFRKCWDAALVIARDHAEQVLADRALNGVEETVFYHGEEVATRRRYDARLLLAHLARLDKRAQAAEACATCDEALLGEHDFDAAVEALAAAADHGGKLQVDLASGAFAPGQCSMCSTLAPETADAGGAQDGGVQDGDWRDLDLSLRLSLMEEAMPGDAQARSGLDDRGWHRAEAARLAAFESGQAEWWCARGE